MFGIFKRKDIEIEINECLNNLTAVSQGNIDLVRQRALLTIEQMEREKISNISGGITYLSGVKTVLIKHHSIKDERHPGFIQVQCLILLLDLLGKKPELFENYWYKFFPDNSSDLKKEYLFNLR